MSYGTSNFTDMLPIKTEAHNLNTTIASAAPRDDGSPATIPTTSPKNRQVDVTGMVKVTVMSKLVLESALVAVTPAKIASEVVVSSMVTATSSEAIVTSVSVPGTVTVTVEPSTSTSVS